LIPHVLTYYSGATADGVYLVNHELDLTKPGLASDISVMTGVNRDEAGVLVDSAPLSNDSLTSYFASKVAPHFSLPSSYISSFSPASFMPPLSPQSAAYSSDQILNASLRIATDGVFTCFDQAKAYSGAKNKAFGHTYAFVFNRTYSTPGYTRTWCDPPKTNPSLPNGDPDAEYFKCHAGEQMIVFGTVRRAGHPDRDGRDTPFMRLVVEYWAAFARTGDPNPDQAAMRARGHWDELDRVMAAGKWTEVNADKPQARLLQWDGGMAPFGEIAQCDALGIPLDILNKEQPQ
jgi:carboxylesterase type B